MWMLKTLMHKLGDAGRIIISFNLHFDSRNISRRHVAPKDCIFQSLPVSRFQSLTSQMAKAPQRELLSQFKCLNTTQFSTFLEKGIKFKYSTFQRFDRSLKLPFFFFNIYKPWGQVSGCHLWVTALTKPSLKSLLRMQILRSTNLLRASLELSRLIFNILLRKHLNTCKSEQCVLIDVGGTRTQN